MTNDEFLWYNRYHCTKKKDVTLNKTHTFFEFLNSISGVDIKIWKMYIQVKKNWVQGNSQGPRTF